MARFNSDTHVMHPHYRCTKTYGHEVGLSCVFRQWRAESHCRCLHGYAIAVSIEFHAEELDANGWVVDFGSMKPIKKFLEDTFDHKLVVAQDDPMMNSFLDLRDARLAQVNVLPRVGMEAFAEYIYNFVEAWLKHNHGERVNLCGVTTSEHGGNSATFYKVPKLKANALKYEVQIPAGVAEADGGETGGQSEK